MAALWPNFSSGALTDLLLPFLQLLLLLLLLQVRGVEGGSCAAPLLWGCLADVVRMLEQLGLGQVAAALSRGCVAEGKLVVLF